MKKFAIYHCTTANHFDKCLKDKEFTWVATIETFSIENAYAMAQNGWNEKYLALKLRSTCVGDVIREHGSCNCYIVMGHGYRHFHLNRMKIKHTLYRQTQKQ